MDEDRNSEKKGSSAPARRQFGAVATAYATSAVHASGEDLRLLVESAGLTGSETVLDLGCGAGHTALALAPLASNVIAIDVTPEMIEVAKQLGASRGIENIDFRLGDATDLPFAADSFDLVASRYSAHHYSDPAKAVKEVARVLRPGGQFLLVDTVAPEDPALDTFYNAAELLRDQSHVRNSRVSEWEDFMRAAGLTPTVLMQSKLHLDGSSWVQRSQTPAQLVIAIRALFDVAGADAREAFCLRFGEEWAWDIPIVLMRGLRG